VNAALRWARIGDMFRDRDLHGRASQWGRLLSAFVTVQVVNQVLALGTGLLLVRSASKEAFALYAVATSVLTFFTTASDLGATGGLLHFFRRSRQGLGSFAASVAAVRQLRRVAFAVGAPIAVAVFVALAVRQRFAPWTVVSCAAIMVLGVACQISTSIHLEVRRLRGQLSAAYRAEVAGNVTRLAATVGLAAAGFLAVAAGGPTALAATVLGTTVAMSLARSAPEPAGRAEIGAAKQDLLGYLAPTLPSALYFSVQGPIVTWLSATFGSTAQIAEVGALGRLSMLVSILSPLPSVLLLPRLAHITDEPLYWRRATQFGLLFVGLLSPFVVMALVLPQPFLALLGSHYRGLSRELPLAMASTAMGVFGGYLVGLTRARGYTRWDSYAMGALAVFQVLLLMAVSLSTVTGVLVFSLGTACFGSLLQILIIRAGRRKDAPVWAGPAT
jgi:O-antigen/teichoic acid export membrane protein